MQLALGARIMLRRNIYTSYRLVNGVVGTIVGFEWPDGSRAPGEQPCGISVKFDNPRLGRETRGSTEHQPVIATQW